VDIRALPAGGLSVPDAIKDRIIKAIQFERMKEKATSTWVIARLFQDIEYDVQERDGIIAVLLSLLRNLFKRWKHQFWLPKRRR